MEKSKIEKMLDDCGITNTKLEELKGKSKGFIIYSEENINTTNNDLKKMYDSVYDEISNISENNIYRYYYYKKLDENNPLHATIVMMNPAFANSEKADDTINNIEKYLHNEHNHFGSFDIVNLYPVRMPKSAKLKDFLKLILKIIAKIISLLLLGEATKMIIKKPKNYLKIYTLNFIVMG